MNESQFRVVSGIILILILFFGDISWVYGFCIVFTAEFLLNIRLTSLLNYSRGIGSWRAGALNDFDAERLLRLVVLVLVGVPSYFLNDLNWAIPWFVALMLVSAGVTQICPMKMMLSRLGFK